jgi:hypothetical protein
MENPDVNPHFYGQLIFNKGANNTLWRINDVGKIRYPYTEK